MRLAYLGTDAFAASVLQGLAAAGSNPVLVVSRPDAPQGRGRRLLPPPTAAMADQLGIPLAQPPVDDPDELRRLLDAANVEAVVLCAYGVLIREPILSNWTILNIHPSLLPRWRGAAPIERALMAGDSTTGVSIIRLVEELDAGPVALVEEVAIDPQDDFAELSDRLVSAGVRLLLEALDRFPNDGLEFQEQRADGVTYAERIQPVDRMLDPERPAVELERRVRALHPHIGARLALPDGEVLGIRKARVVSSDGLRAGEFDVRDGELVVGCADGALLVSRLVPSGGREMDSGDWLRGRGGRP